MFKDFKKANCRPFSLGAAIRGEPFGRYRTAPCFGDIIKPDVPGRKPLLVSFEDGKFVEHYTEQGTYTLYREDASDLLMFPIGRTADGKYAFPGDTLYFAGGTETCCLDKGSAANVSRLYYDIVAAVQRKEGPQAGPGICSAMQIGENEFRVGHWPSEKFASALIKSPMLTVPQYRDVLVDAVKRGLVTWSKGENK